MASRTLFELVDDLDGSPAEQTVSFGIGGRDYEIDLNARNAEALREAFQPFVDKARPVVLRRPSRRTMAHRRRSADIRVWARAQGYHIQDHGRIGANIIAEYERTHQP